jgi:hypothetical protein
MASFGMLHHVMFVINDVSEDLSASKIRVTRFGELGTALALLVTASFVPSSPILVILMKEALSSSETSVLTIVTRRNIPDAILHSHRRGDLKSYILIFLISVRLLNSRHLLCSSSGEET